MHPKRFQVGAVHEPEGDAVRDLGPFQEEREFEAVADADERARAAGEAAGSRAGRAGREFLNRTLRPLMAAVAADRAQLRDGVGRLNGYALPMLALPESILALLTLRTVFVRVVARDPDDLPSSVDLAETIGRSCYWEWRRRALRAAHRGRPDADLPNLQTLLLARHQDDGAIARDRVRLQLAALDATDAHSAEWRALGGRLLDLVGEQHLIETVRAPHNGHHIRRVRLADTLSRQAETWLDDSAVRALVAPRFLPMLVPPRPWRSLEGGGFLTTIDPETSHLVKHRGHKRHLAALKTSAERDGALETVYRAVNALQGTPWRLNAPVYALLRYALTHELALPGLPAVVDPATLAVQRKELAAERARLRARKRLEDGASGGSSPETTLAAGGEERAACHAAETALEQDWERYHERSEDLQLAEEEQARKARLWLLLGACRRIEDATAEIDQSLATLPLYFPYQLDSRGRAYCMVANPSPQGNDHARALLEFADGKPLGERGRFWLAVHLANTHGYDKVPLADRAAWPGRHEALIRELATLVDPDGAPVPARIAGLSTDARGFWEEADRKTRWQFFAACVEWVRSHDPGFVSHLPVALDASASGLQHLSALLRDEAGAHATNLTRADAPQDIYDRVAARLRTIVEREAAAGDPRATAWTRDGLIIRETVKRGVMTTPYGVTDRGLQDQLKVYLKKRRARLDNPREALPYLAAQLKTCIDEEVPSARLVMDWLKEVADVCARHGCGVSWTTPAGFPVVVEHLHYHDGDPIRIRWTEPSGKRREYRLLNRVPQELLGVDAEEQRRTITPNYVHSLDGAHLQRTVARLHEEGLRHFAVIHDSYGVHARDVDQMLDGLRAEFAAMYGGPLLLDRFVDEQIACPDAPSGLREQLRALKQRRPAVGGFDVEEVRAATYMFS